MLRPPPDWTKVGTEIRSGAFKGLLKYELIDNTNGYLPIKDIILTLGNITQVNKID